MAKSKAQNDAESPLRTPKAKKSLGLKVPQISLPHLELVSPPPEKADRTLPSQSSHTRRSSQSSQTSQPNSNHSQQLTQITPSESSSAEKINEGSTALPSQTSQSSHARQTSQSAQSVLKQSVAPVRDYQKIPNSTVKKAIPEGLFKSGKSKHLYDVLYSLTRGAIEPKRSIRISKTKLMKQSGIGSRITFDSTIAHFEAVGLIKMTVFAGEHEGNEFEVYTYDEIETMPSQSSQASQTSLTSHAQKLDRVVSLETSQSSHSLNDANNNTFVNPKTIFKTLNLNDDDAPLVMSGLEKLQAAARAATGKDLTRKDWEAFGDIIEILIGETAIAGTRTKSISVYLKFAAENLRRRLYEKKREPKPENSVYTGAKNTEPIANQSEAESEEEILPLGAERELVLDNLRRIVGENGREAISIFKVNYLEEDWEWLINHLEKDM